MGRAILASAAISALVLPVTVDGLIATDGGWNRNFPLDHAYRNPSVDAIAAFRYIMSYRPTDLAFLERLRDRLEQFQAVPQFARCWPRFGSPRSGRAGRAPRTTRSSSSASCASRSRATRARGAARRRPGGVGRSAAARADVVSAAVAAAPPWRRQRLRAELEAIFASARFPFRHDRHVPTLIVRGTPGETGLDPTFKGEPWPEESKRGLIERGYRLTDAELAANGELGQEVGKGPGQAGGPLPE